MANFNSRSLFCGFRNFVFAEETISEAFPSISRSLSI